eukprot:scaffold158482_cov35-Tisochrysis_lutea.AAC.4
MDVISVQKGGTSRAPRQDVRTEAAACTHGLGQCAQESSESSANKEQVARANTHQPPMAELACNNSQNRACSARPSAVNRKQEHECLYGRAYATGVQNSAPLGRRGVPVAVRERSHQPEVRAAEFSKAAVNGDLGVRSPHIGLSKKFRDQESARTYVREQRRTVADSPLLT